MWKPTLCIAWTFQEQPKNEIQVIKSWMMGGISDDETCDWSLYNNFAKRLKPGCSKKHRKKLLSEKSIPGVTDDDM